METVPSQSPLPSNLPPSTSAISTEPEQLMDDENEQQIDIESKLCISVRDKLESMTYQNPPSERKFYFARVPKHLRDVNEKSYEPQIIAIGPYHRYPRIKPHLELMEEHKIYSLSMLLRRNGKGNVERYVQRMEELGKKARKCYAEVVNLNENDFVEMMLLDACFIVELFRYYCGKPIMDPNPVLDTEWIKIKLIRDLLLVENQLPFFVLCEFFTMTTAPDEANSFFEIFFRFFNDRLPIHCRLSRNPTINIGHSFHNLLSLVHRSLVWPFLENQPSITRETQGNNWEFIRCATELQEAGIQFIEVEKADTLFEIRFENGTMEIPRLKIDDNTESFLRNLIVFEQFCPDEALVIDYVKFMDCLINSAKDVEVLCQRKIVHNCLGDDEVVATMFNRLCDSVTISSCNYFRDICSNVNKHCSISRNKWMASLKHKYFKTPWTFISFIAAGLLLLFTLIQTVFSVAAYFK